MLPPETAAAPTRDQSKLVMVIIAGFLAVATLIGFWGVSRIGSGMDLSGATSKPTVTVTGAPTTVTPGSTPSASASASPSESAGEPIAILQATGFDPEGDSKERNSEAPRVYDGKTSTAWTSEGYASSNLGGLKTGVGVLLDLGQPARVKEVVLTLPDVSDVQVFLTDSDSIDGATEIGSSQGKKGQITLKAPTRRPPGPRSSCGSPRSPRSATAASGPPSLRSPSAEVARDVADDLPLQERTDRDLMAQHCAGDPEAFGEIFRRHRDRMWALALRTTGNRELASDCLQDAFISAFRRADSYRGEAAVTTWLHRIVVNACLDRLRRDRPTTVLPERELPDRTDAHGQVETRLDVREALARLPRASGWRSCSSTCTACRWPRRRPSSRSPRAP